MMRPGLSMLACSVLVFSILLPTLDAADPSANRLSYLDGPLDPYYVGRGFPRLATPQWVGEEGVDAVVVLAIDDMREPERYEAFLRPILDRLRQYQGRSSLSIMTNRVDPNDPRLQQWLGEGLNIDVHTLDHPCPLLCDSDLPKARQTYDGCVDLLAQIPGNQPVAFRMPCCDSMNSPSPRFFETIFQQVTPHGRFLTIDSSVFNITTREDAELPESVTRDADGRERFRKYLPFESFVNTIEDYPYPYVIGGMCWEFPCIVPSDWEAQNLHQPNNPQTVDDLRAALDAVVRKQGVMNLVFHPHGWIRNDQIVQLIDHAAQNYGGRVKFLNFRDAQQRLDTHLLAGVPLRGVQGQPSGVRLLDVNQDGWLDVVRHDAGGELTTRCWRPQASLWDETVQPLAADSLHFGLPAADGPVALVAVTESELQRWEFDGQRWQRRPLPIDADRLSNSWRDRLARPAQLDAVRWRDVDADGACELLLSQGSNSLILRRVGESWQPAAFGLPSGVRLVSDRGGDAGLRWVDLDSDGRDECLFSDAQRYSVHRWLDWDRGWQTLLARDRNESSPADAQVAIPPFIRPDGTNNGVWVHSGHLWWQNEDTARLPDKVDRLPLKELSRLAEVRREREGEAEPPGDARSDASSSARTDDPRADEAERDAADAFPGPLEPNEALSAFHSSVDAQVELVAAEPLIADPIAFDWAPDGRLFVVEMRDYPEDPAVDDKRAEADAPAASMPLRGRVRVLWDDDQDGRYDRAETFLDDLEYPTGVKVWRDGVIVSGAPAIILATDTDGDHRADQIQTLFRGFGEGNQQHRVNSLRWGIDNWLYLANGDSGGRIESFAGGEALDLGGRDLRINPDSGRMELVSGQTQYGRARDDLGNWFGGNNSDPVWHYVLEERYLRRNSRFAPPSVRRAVPEMPGPAPVFPKSRTLPRFNDFDRADRFTSACGPLIVHDSGFGEPGSIDSFVCEPVHNLIHREIVAVDGLSFRSRRAPEDAQAEFLASTDNWFRPVLLRLGPDGAIWVADMYRLVIEHTTWIPQEWQQKLDVRAGNDRGRIYRVFSRKRPPERPFRRLDQLDLPQLIERLDDANRWQRDMAHQLLLWRADRASIEPLRALAESSSRRPVARMHALYLLDALRAIDSGWLAELICQAEPAVARQAVVLAESRLCDDPRLLNALLARVTTDDLPLRQQLAYSLGDTNDPRAAQALARLGTLEPSDPAIAAAVLSSLTPANVAHVCRTVLDQGDKASDFYRELLGQAIALGDDKLRVEVLMALLADRSDFDAHWRFETLAGLLTRYVRQYDDLRSLPPEVSGGLARLVADARRVACDENSELTTRLAAAELLRAEVDPEGGNRTALESLLGPRQPPELQGAAGVVLLREFDRSAVAAILDTWGGFSPRTRNRLLDELLARPELTVAFLETAEQQRIDLQLDAQRRQRLFASADSRVQEIAKRLFAAGAGEATRDQVVAAYRTASAGEPDRRRGEEVFARACASCHRFAGVGHAVGPDLEALGNKSEDFLLTAILDPNRAVESSFVEYLVETVDGRQISGIVRAETATTVTLLMAEGKEQTILRQDIEGLVATGRSLMPEGLEKDISAEQMRDLLAFLTSFQPARKWFAGNEPRVAPRRDDGSVRLLAMHAEIYGPSLVFEPHYRNLGFWSSSLDYAVWTVELPRAGTFAVWADYACHDASAGNRFAILAEDDYLSHEVQATGTWDDYRNRPIGRIRLPAGRSRVMLRSEGHIGSYLMDLHQITLLPVD